MATPHMHKQNGRRRLDAATATAAAATAARGRLIIIHVGAGGRDRGGRGGATALPRRGRRRGPRQRAAEAGQAPGQSHIQTY